MYKNIVKIIIFKYTNDNDDDNDKWGRERISPILSYLLHNISFTYSFDHVKENKNIGNGNITIR